MKQLAPVSFVLALLLFALAGCVTKNDPKPGRTLVRKPPVIVPARILGNQFIVEAKWDKHGPWRFLVDTGSTITLVSDEFARRYSSGEVAENAPTVHVRSADGKATTLPPVTIREIQLGTARFEYVQALIYNFDDLSAQFGMKIDGVLAFPLFRQTIFTLDYPQARLVIRPSWPPIESGADFGTTVRFNNTQRTPVIPVRLGAETFVALIDSGNDAGLTLNPVGLHPVFAVPPRPGVTVSTLTGSRVQEIGRLDQSLDIGPCRFEKPIVDLTDQLSSVGGELLGHFAVTFDQLHNQVGFLRSSADPVSSPARHSCGLSFTKASTYWRVAGVVPGSPADAAGVQIGDLVTRINGDPVSEWNFNRYDAMVRKASEITFTFLKGNNEIPVVISAFDLVP